MLRCRGAARIWRFPEPSEWKNQPLSVYVLESYEKIEGKAQPDENAPSARQYSPANISATLRRLGHTILSVVSFYHEITRYDLVSTLTDRSAHPV